MIQANTVRKINKLITSCLFGTVVDDEMSSFYFAHKILAY